MTSAVVEIYFSVRRLSFINLCITILQALCQRSLRGKVTVIRVGLMIDASNVNLGFLCQSTGLLALLTGLMLLDNDAILVEGSAAIEVCILSTFFFH
jgi:hypothetical protein